MNVSGTICLYAFGGKGGNGGGCSYERHEGVLPHQSGGGGGGFPGAGIGGGGAGASGGTTAAAAGGFTNACAESVENNIGGISGKSISKIQVNATGGSYYESYINIASVRSDGVTLNYLFDYSQNYNDTNVSLRRNYNFGGIGGGRCWNPGGATLTYDPSRGGKGGIISVSTRSTVNAYNGSYITSGSYDRVNDQALIYAQAGYDIKSIRELVKVKVVNARTIEDLVTEWSRKDITNPENDYDFSAYRTILSPYDSTCGDLAGNYKLGIGSGAGGSQTIDGNGTYSIDSSLD